jgi:hypothetical protein
MKLGLVLECDTGGPDEQVLKCFARRLQPGVTVQANALGDKPTVFSKGVETAQKLVEASRCDKVLIVWDLKPYFEGPPPARRCQDEAAILRDRLQAVPAATRRKISLLCLTWEIETWLLADAAAVRSHLSTDAHRCYFKCGNPLAKSNAKATLDKACKTQRGKASGYTDFRDAIRIACQITRTNKLRRVPSFARFSYLISGNQNAEFQVSSDACSDLIHAAFYARR